MENPTLYLTLAATTLASLALLSIVGLKGFTGWLELKRAELDAQRNHDAPVPSATNRIEIADLKERLRKLEAIAAGVDL
jgi:hypothetical protein